MPGEVDAVGNRIPFLLHLDSLGSHHPRESIGAVINGIIADAWRKKIEELHPSASAAPLSTSVGLSNSPLEKIEYRPLRCIKGDIPTQRPDGFGCGLHVLTHIEECLLLDPVITQQDLIGVNPCSRIFTADMYTHALAEVIFLSLR
jgi:hypothetical protein